MTYHLTWLATFAVIIVGVAIGVGSAFVFREDPVRTLWALVVALVFIVSGCTSVLFDYSWMASATARLAAQAMAITTFLAGITYAVRDRA